MKRLPYIILTTYDGSNATFFIHGVNVRISDKGYEKDRSRRGKLFRDLVLHPLSGYGNRYEGIKVHDIYWGDLGVSFSWKLASVPKIRTLDAFGPDDVAAPTDLLVEQALETIARPDSLGEITAFSESSDGTLKRASANDPVRFAETLLLPVLLSDYDLSDESSEEEGELQALLAQATRDAASDQSVQVEMKAAPTDAHLIGVLTRAIERRFRTLAGVAVSSENDQNESYGPQFLEGARLRVRELFGRVAPAWPRRFRAGSEVCPAGVPPKVLPVPWRHFCLPQAPWHSIRSRSDSAAGHVKAEGRSTRAPRRAYNRCDAFDGRQYSI